MRGQIINLPDKTKNGLVIGIDGHSYYFSENSSDKSLYIYPGAEVEFSDGKDLERAYETLSTKHQTFVNIDKCLSEPIDGYIDNMYITMKHEPKSAKLVETVKTYVAHGESLNKEQAIKELLNVAASVGANAITNLNINVSYNKLHKKFFYHCVGMLSTAIPFENNSPKDDKSSQENHDTQDNQNIQDNQKNKDNQEKQDNLKVVNDTTLSNNTVNETATTNSTHATQTNITSTNKISITTDKILKHSPNKKTRFRIRFLLTLCMFMIIPIWGKIMIKYANDIPTYISTIIGLAILIIILLVYHFAYSHKDCGYITKLQNLDKDEDN